MSHFIEFRYGWPVVVSSALGIALGMSPLPFYTIGVFAGPLMQEFGWNISQVMSALAIFTVVAMIAAPLVGYLTDRLGVRKVVLASIFLFSLTMMSFALNNGSMTRYLLIWGILAFAGAGTLPITFTRAVSNWFNQKRGFALGVSLIGTGVAGSFAKLYAGFLIQEVGWRMAYVGVGALPLLIAFPVAFFLFRDIDDPKAKHRAKHVVRLNNLNGGAQAYGMTLGQALKDWRFWLLALTFVPLSFAIGGPIPNLETMLGDKGFDVGEAIFLASLIGYSVFVGRLVGGYLLDHIWAPGLACALLMLPAISMFLMQGNDLDYAQTALSIILLGFAAGLEYDLLAYIVSRYFGIRSYGAIYGVLYGFFALGAGFGPAVYGRFFQQTGSYDTILAYSMWAFIFCSLALLLLGRYRDEELKKMVAEPAQQATG
jgi:predicted MFS family arabinose efflux permease